MSPKSDNKPVALALGMFDGVHIGHQALARRVVDAKKQGCRSIVACFDQHPQRLLCPDHAPKLLTTQQEKEAILLSLGVDEVIFQHFDHTMAQMPWQTYVDHLMARWDIAEIVVGENYRFGAGAKGDVASLRQYLSGTTTHVEVVSPVMLDGEMVSSTRIRECLDNGAIILANRMLGRSYAISGEVISGRKVGRKMGFPTLNIAYDPDKQLPQKGVYATRVDLGVQNNMPAIVNVGTRPTFGNEGAVSIEAHLIDIQGDFYGQEAQINFTHFIRGEKRFDTAAQLTAQIRADIDAVMRT